MSYKVNWFIKGLSYFREIVLESAESDQHEELEVSIYKGQYRLNTRNAIYSWGDKYDNFSGAFQKIDITKYPPENILLLGLGLGSIPYILESKLGIETDYDIVEYDEVIIHLAQDYLLADLHSHFNYFNLDAEIFMRNNTQQYDLICMDIFEDNIVPEQFLSLDFLRLLKKAMSQKTRLIFNCLAETEEDKKRAQVFFDKRFKLIFPDSKLYSIHFNYMLIV